MSATVNTSVEDSVAVLELNRPEAYNALSPEMMRKLRAAVEAIARDDAVRCVIVRGAGDHFTTGGNVKAFYPMSPSSQSGEERRSQSCFPA